MNEKPSVDPAFTFAVALGVSLILWWPTMQNTMRGDLDITDAGIRYFLALALAWAGTYGICSLVAMYASNPRRPAPKPPGLPETSPQRRKEDIQDVPVVEDTEAA